jgi:hypothetical protein
LGSAATAGQIVRVVRLTIVSSRCPVRRFGFGTAAGFGLADLSDSDGDGLDAEADGTIGAPAAGVEDAVRVPLSGPASSSAAARPSAQAQAARTTERREFFRPSR